MIGEDNHQTQFLMSGEIGMRKSANTVPHDIGDPGNKYSHKIMTLCRT